MHDFTASGKTCFKPGLAPLKKVLRLPKSNWIKFTPCLLFCLSCPIQYHLVQVQIRLTGLRSSYENDIWKYLEFFCSRVKLVVWTFRAWLFDCSSRLAVLEWLCFQLRMCSSVRDYDDAETRRKTTTTSTATSFSKTTETMTTTATTTPETWSRSLPPKVLKGTSSSRQYQLGCGLWPLCLKCLSGEYPQSWFKYCLKVHLT